MVSLAPHSRLNPDRRDFPQLAVIVLLQFPERAVAAKAIIEPKFLDNELISFPAMALERARLELGHMAELTESMLSKVEAAFVNRI